MTCCGSTQGLRLTSTPSYHITLRPFLPTWVLGAVLPNVTFQCHGEPKASGANSGGFPGVKTPVSTRLRKSSTAASRTFLTSRQDAIRCLAVWLAAGSCATTVPLGLGRGLVDSRHFGLWRLTAALELAAGPPSSSSSADSSDDPATGCCGGPHHTGNAIASVTRVFKTSSAT
jgi:hypothetical protein